MKLTDQNLLDHKFTYLLSDIEKNVNHLNKKIMLATQYLDARFCIQYILDMDIDNGSEDSYIFDIDYIHYFQPHIKYEDLKDEFKKQN